MKNWLRSFKYSFLLLTTLVIVGCGNSNTVILENLDQDAANSVLVSLGENNINATRQRVKDGTYSITVNAGAQRRALEILQSNGMPTKNYTNLGIEFKKDSFISSPLEEQSRFIYALDDQVSAMVSEIDGVVSVSTQISLPPPNDNLLQTEEVHPAASVLIKFKDGYHLEMYTNRIKQLVANAVPGLMAANVVVLFINQSSS